MAANRMKASVVTNHKTVQVEQVDVPIPNDDEILLRVLTIGLNPTDWKHVDFISKPGAIIGCDFVGEVVQLGSLVPPNRISKGEVRWGFMRGGMSDERGGAFAQFVTVQWDLTGLVPKNITPQQAASIPIPFATAVQALYLRLKLPETPQTTRDKWIIIWSGATAVGQYAIQLAKLSGLKVATTASEARWPLLKTLGADLTVDYKDPDAVKKLKEGTNDGIVYGLDCISEKHSLPSTEQSFSSKGGHLVAIQFDLSYLKRSDVKAEATLGYTVLGADQRFGDSALFKASPEDQALYIKWCEKSTELFESGKLKPMEVEVIGGLEDVQKGFDILKLGKHNTKLVCNVA